MCVVALAGLGCGSDATRDNPKREVEHAIQTFVRGLRDHDSRLVCAKLFASTDLPPTLARRLGVPSGEPGLPSHWRQGERECLRGFGKHGEFASMGVPSIKITRIALGGPADSASGITASAIVRARIAEGGHKEQTVTYHLVRFDGDWKIVFEVN